MMWQKVMECSRAKFPTRTCQGILKLDNRRKSLPE
ncbi:COA1 isoform 10 [Pongo abelii]|uniref:COA1 isoform 10 n=1 Tax=Pongo abelii TaxID=9601 RepID=A0A2J8STD3_PONAB|nr:COA1 isoform 8 [Pongo abelii]PNJ24022.1 COA1 isoform 10 [Pongo abelii]